MQIAILRGRPLKMFPIIVAVAIKSKHFRRNTIFREIAFKDPLGGGEWTKRFMPKIFVKKTSWDWYVSNWMTIIYE